MSNLISFVTAYWDHQLDVCEAALQATPASPECMRAYADELEQFMAGLTDRQLSSRVEVRLLETMRAAIREARWVVENWGKPVRRAAVRRRRGGWGARQP